MRVVDEGQIPPRRLASRTMMALITDVRSSLFVDKRRLAEMHLRSTDIPDCQYINWPSDLQQERT